MEAIYGIYLHDTQSTQFPPAFFSGGYGVEAQAFFSCREKRLNNPMKSSLSLNIGQEIDMTIHFDVNKVFW